jgi:hypothetical protein
MGTPGRLAGTLDRRQQQGNEDANDRDYDQQLDQGKAVAPKHKSAPRMTYAEVLPTGMPPDQADADQPQRCQQQA